MNRFKTGFEKGFTGHANMDNCVDRAGEIQVASDLSAAGDGRGGDM